MKYILFFLLLCGTQISYSQPKKKPAKTEGGRSTTPGKKFEMKQYFFVMLSKGPHRDQDSVTAAKLQEGHMANIQRLAGMGKLAVAGPFGDDGNWRGIFILDCATKEEAEAMLKTDPAIGAGRMIYEIHPWWTAKNCVFK